MSITEQFKSRKKKLGITFDFLAKRTGISVSGLKHIFNSGAETAIFSNVLAIARALEISLVGKEEKSEREIIRERSEEKAKHLVKLVQGTCGLEAQAIDANDEHELIQSQADRLQSGSRRLLWQ